jgi:hypothetical protein
MRAKGAGSMAVSKAKTIAVAVAIATGMLASEASVFATAAKADSNRHRGHGYDRGYDRPVQHRQFDNRRYPEPRREQHRDRTGDAVAATVLGIGALIVGAAVADAARRNRNQQRERDDD